MVFRRLICGFPSSLGAISPSDLVTHSLAQLEAVLAKTLAKTLQAGSQKDMVRLEGKTFSGALGFSDRPPGHEGWEDTCSEARRLPVKNKSKRNWTGGAARIYSVPVVSLERTIAQPI